MIDFIGYIALLLNVTSMAMKKILYLRLCSMTANAIYVLYGLMLNALPMVIGGSIAVLLHCYWVRRIIISKYKTGMANEKH